MVLGSLNGSRSQFRCVPTLLAHAGIFATTADEVIE